MARSVVPMNPLAALVAFLGFQAERGDRPGVETGDADGLAGLLAVAVAAVLDPPERFVDLGNQLALPVTRAQLKRPVSLRRGAIGQVGMIFGLALQMLEGLSRFAEDVLFPVDELLPEILKLTLVHELLVLGRTVTRTISQHGRCLHGHSEPPKLPETRAALIANKTVHSICTSARVPLGRT